MRYVGVADDLIFAATGDKVAAEHLNVPLAFGDLGEIELDLASDSYRRIREMLKPIFAAHAAANDLEPKAAIAEPSAKEIAAHVTPETKHTNGAAYKAALRTWAARVGRLDEIKRYYYPVGLCNDFDAYLMRRGALELWTS